jgi:hypothetical protein
LAKGSVQPAVPTARRQQFCDGRSTTAVGRIMSGREMRRRPGQTQTTSASEGRRQNARQRQGKETRSKGINRASPCRGESDDAAMRLGIDGRESVGDAGRLKISLSRKSKAQPALPATSRLAAARPPGLTVYPLRLIPTSNTSNR